MFYACLCFGAKLLHIFQGHTCLFVDVVNTSPLAEFHRRVAEFSVHKAVISGRHEGIDIWAITDFVCASEPAVIVFAKLAVKV